MKTLGPIYHLKPEDIKVKLPLTNAAIQFNSSFTEQQVLRKKYNSCLMETIISRAHKAGNTKFKPRLEALEDIYMTKPN